MPPGLGARKEKALSSPQSRVWVQVLGRPLEPEPGLRQGQAVQRGAGAFPKVVLQWRER